MSMIEVLEARIQAKIAVQESGCWLWTAAKNPSGYGAIMMRPHGVRNAHRVVYESLRGPIAAGLELDHLCRIRACVNPDHLEPVTHRENCDRGTSPVAANGRKTHCKNGHEFNAANTLRWRGSRICRACKRTRRAARRKASKQP